MTKTPVAAARHTIRIAALAFMALSPASLVAGAAYAQTSAVEKSYNLDIPAQTLARSMAALSTQTGLQVVYGDDEPLSVSAPAVRGRMTVEQALARVTARTGFTYRFSGPGVVTLVKLPVGNGGEEVAGVVSVEGYQGSPYFGGAGVAAGVNGTSGARDITSTEGTGSFTSGALTIGSKVAQAMKDVPQSVSVLTNERMRQQNVTDFASAMKQLAGVTLVQAATSIDTNFYSRGFVINSIQIDGGAPLALGLADGATLGFSPQIDMSIYDHVELLRGAAGQFGVYGDPSGTVNLVRKKPLDHSQFTLETQAGSWSNYRVVADATSPLALDGRLRGRLVMTYQNNKHFYDVAKDNKTLVYGIAELDVTPTTLLTAGINHIRQNSVPWYLGLPRYQTGDDLGLPRSTALAFPWNRWNFTTTEIFGAIEQKIGSDWTAKLNLTRNRQSSTRKLGYSFGAVNPVTNAGPILSGTYGDYASRQFSAEATLSGAFTVFSQRQEITIGVNRVDSDGAGLTGYADLVSSAAAPYQPYPGGPLFCNDISACPSGYAAPPINVFAFNPDDPLYTEPRNPLPNTRYRENGQVETAAYINLRLTAFDRLHLTTGFHWSRYEYKLTADLLCTTTVGSCAGKQIGDVRRVFSAPYTDEHVSWPPPVSLSFDVTDELTTYAGYTDIYRSQAGQRTVDNKPLDPVTGSNWEAGIKWAGLEGKLNVSFAAYRIKQKGFYLTDPDNPFGDFDGCCYIEDPDARKKSTGFDVEVTGEVRPGLQISASYTYNKNKQTIGGGEAIFGADGEPFVTIQPKHLYKLWASYDFGASGSTGMISGLTLSAGINGQSSGYQSGEACPAGSLETDPLTGVATCPGEDLVPFNFTVPAYALVSARIDYRFSDTWSLSLNLENILDKTYYQTVGETPSYGHWYGAPRSFAATLRAQW